MILAMAWQMIDGSGSYLSGKIQGCRRAISQMPSHDADTEKLVRTVSLALNLAEQGLSENEELNELSGWVHSQYVHGYFGENVRDAEANPYFGESGSSGTLGQPGDDQRLRKFDSSTPT